MNRLKLKWRVVVYAAIAHLLVAIAGGCVLLLNAQQAVRTEIVAAQDSAVTLLQQLAASLAVETAEDVLLTDVANRIIQPRHVSIAVFAGDDGASVALQEPISSDASEEETAPDWFLRLVSPDVTIQRVLLVASGETVGHAEIISVPNDEANEVWEDVQSLFFLWAASTLALLVALSVAIGRALAPIKHLQDALAHLETGDYSTKAAEADSPDLKPISLHIDRLTQTLRAAERDRLMLSRQLLQLRDAERKELARELHDELGPCLFGLTVEVDALRQKPSDLAQSVETLNQLVRRIRATNTRILNTLRPQTVGHLPLTDVIADLLTDFEAQSPDVAFELSFEDLTPPIDETRDLTLYRIVQEAITNALRHGDAKRVCVSLGSSDNVLERLSVTVRDFGAGLATDWQDGRGMIGMRERLSALDGNLLVENGLDGGTILRATLPLRSAKQMEDSLIERRLERAS